MRPGIGRNVSCALGDCLTSRPKGHSWPRELWFLIYSCTHVLTFTNYKSKYMYLNIHWSLTLSHTLFSMPHTLSYNVTLYVDLMTVYEPMRHVCVCVCVCGWVGGNLSFLLFSSSSLPPASPSFSLSPSPSLSAATSC